MTRLVPVAALALAALVACGGDATKGAAGPVPAGSSGAASTAPGSAGAPGAATSSPSALAATPGTGGGTGAPSGMPGSGATGPSGAIGSSSPTAAPVALPGLLPTTADLGEGWKTDGVKETDGASGPPHQYCAAPFASDADRTARAAVVLRWTSPAHGVYAEATRYRDAGKAMEDWRRTFGECRSFKAGGAQGEAHDLAVAGVDASVLYEYTQDGRTVWSGIVVRRAGDVVLSATVFGIDRSRVEDDARRVGGVYAAR